MVNFEDSFPWLIVFLSLEHVILVEERDNYEEEYDDYLQYSSNRCELTHGNIEKQLNEKTLSQL
ncbi:unnamed protein product [Rhodiola kirilowii]